MKPEEFVQNLYHQEYRNKQVLFKLIKSKYRDPFETVFYFRECFNSKVCDSSGFRFSTTLDYNAIYHNYFSKHEEFDIELFD